jgi:hypothetical protein
LAIIDQQPDGEERNGERRRDDYRQQELESGGPFTVEWGHDLFSACCPSRLGGEPMSVMRKL